MKKRRNNGKNKSGVYRLFCGIIINALVYTALTLIISVFALLSDDPLQKVRMLSLAALLLSGIISGLWVTKKHGGMSVCAVSAISFSIIMMLFGVILSKSAPGIGNIINYAAYVGISVLFSKLTSLRRTKRKFKGRKGG